MFNIWTVAYQPIAFSLGAWPVYWYGLAYCVALLQARFFVLRWWPTVFPNVSLKVAEGMVNYLMAGIILGGRLGHVILYDLTYYLAHPAKILCVWEGGMAFHGAVVGVGCSFFFGARRYGIAWLKVLDVWLPMAPWGIFWGRLGNFMNQELYGPPTTQPWGVVFSGIDAVVRHPAQLYSALGEGILLGCGLGYLFPRYRHHTGRITGAFLMGYAGMRWSLEYWRIPEGLVWGLTLGQWYCIPLGGVGLFLWTRRKLSLKI